MGNMTEDNELYKFGLSCDNCNNSYFMEDMVELDDKRMVYRCMCGYENLFNYFRR